MIIISLFRCILGEKVTVWQCLTTCVVLLWQVDQYLIVSVNVSLCVSGTLVVPIESVVVIVTWRPSSLLATAMRKVGHPSLNILSAIFRVFVHSLDARRACSTCCHRGPVFGFWILPSQQGADRRMGSDSRDITLGQSTVKYSICQTVLQSVITDMLMLQWNLIVIPVFNMLWEACVSLRMWLINGC